MTTFNTSLFTTSQRQHIVELFLNGDSIATLATAYEVPKDVIETVLRQEAIYRHAGPKGKERILKVRIAELENALQLTQHVADGSFEDGWTIQATGHQMDAIRRALGMEVPERE